MQPAAPVVDVVEHSVGDVEQALDLAPIAGLLVELADDGAARGLVELQAATGQCPQVARPDRGSDVAEQDPASAS